MHVTKRNGSQEALDINKIHKVAEWACKGLNVSQSELEVEAKLLFFPNIKTSQIHDALIAAAAGLNSIESQDYTFVAGRLLLQKVFKEAWNDVEYPALSEYIDLGVAEKKLDPRLSSLFDHRYLNSLIKPERDLMFTYIGLQTLADRYFIRDGNRKIIELPQHFYMRVAMGLAIEEKEPNVAAANFYEILSKHEFQNSTPTLFNSGTLHSQLASCFLNTVADTITNDPGTHRFASIYGTIEECAILSKYAGGLGTDWQRVRDSGSWIEGTDGKSSGIVPYLKVYNDTAVAVNQGGKRSGSFAPYIEPSHPDLYAFIDLKKESGDDHQRAHDIFPALWMPDLFFQRKAERGMWSFFSVKKYPELHELWGAAYEARYVELEAAGEFTHQIPALDVWKKILNSLFETGHPWITFKDECNSRSPQQHAGVIHSSNLCCITADQRVVTDRGMVTVGELYAQGGENIVMGLNGPSNAGAMLLPRPDAPIVRIETAEGYSHKVTPDHRIWKNQVGWIEAQHLEPGDQILIQQSEGLFGTEHNVELGLIAGLIAGDGTFNKHSAFIDIWSPKTLRWSGAIEKAVEIVLKNNVALGTTSTNSPKFAVQGDGKKARLSSAPLRRLLESHGFAAETKHRVPEFVWVGDKSTVSAYLRGLYLTDGNLQTGTDACTMVLGSVDKEMLQDVQILWANFGVKTSISKMHDGGLRDFGERGDVYECKPMYRLLITSIQGCKIAQRVTLLGNFRQGDVAEVFMGRIKKEGYKQKMYATFTSLTPLPNEDAYCLVVDSESHAWTVNGLITHNTEITLNTSDDETAVCNIGSINLAKIDGAEHLQKVVTIAMRMLDNVIDINFYGSDRARASNMKHRPVGLGMMGYTEWLVKNGIDWESQDHLEAVDEMMEHFSFNVIQASMLLAKERGRYASFEGSLWSKGILPIDTAKLTAKALTERGTVLDWEGLRMEVMKHGMRNSNTMAIAPTATISNIVGTTATIEPIFLREVAKKNMSGTFTVTDPCLRYDKPELCKEAFDIDPMWLIKAAAVRQKWLDQAQSTNIFVKANVKGKELDDIYTTAWQLGLKTTYYLRGQSAKAKVVGPAVIEVAEPEVEAEPVFCSIDSPNCEACS